MSSIAITKPELAYLQTLKSLAANPAAPFNIQKDPAVLMRLMQNDFKAAWNLTNDPGVPGKNPPTLPTTDAGINKVRRYYKYEKPMCDETVETCEDNICEVTNTTEETTGYLAVDINLCASKSWTVSVEEFNLLLETPSERRADKIRRAAYAIKNEINKKCIENLYAQISDYKDATSGLSATKTITLLSDKGDILPVSMSKIRKEYRQSLYNGPFAIFGGDVAATYFDVRELRLSPEGKMGVSDNLSNFPLIYDSQFDVVFQGLQEDSLSHGLTVPIGSFFIDFYNEFTGYKNMLDPNYAYTTMMIDGLLYDYSMKFDECDKVWKEMLTLHYGFGGIPESIYCDSNGLIRHWIFACGEVDCDAFA